MQQACQGAAGVTSLLRRSIRRLTSEQASRHRAFTSPSNPGACLVAHFAVDSTRMRRGTVGSVATAALALLACAPPVPTRDQVAAIQLAAATEMVEDLTSNAGSIETVCLGYAGDWEDPGLPRLAATSTPRALDVFYMDGCVDVEGRLVARAGGGQAISVSIGAPDMTDGDEAEVTVYTSTGSIDLAVYHCAMRDFEGIWRAERCEMGATT